MMYGQKKSELVFYLVLWATLYAASAMSIYLGKVSSQATAFDWQGLLSAWGLLSMFFIAFCIHNFLIAPQLVYSDRSWLYGILTSLLVVAFMGYQMMGRPGMSDEPRPPKPSAEGRMMERPPLPAADNRMPVMDDRMPAMDDRMPMADDRVPPELPKEEKKMKHEDPPSAFGGKDTVAFVIVCLLIGLNIGVKYYFKSLDDRKRMKDLERENLNRQLEYLKYQISPHFFMNTLNNIHALVDINPEQAKYTIEVLSKLMRYVLYEGNQTMAPLQKELDFIGHYVDLMRIRYTDKVRITVSQPSDVPDVQVPLLLFTIFVENAFKHGVSYRQESFIEVAVSVDEAAQEIVFCCNNSRKPEQDDGHGGVGLKNAVRRLQLIYGDNYHLHTDITDQEYRLVLRFPIIYSSEKI